MAFIVQTLCFNVSHWELAWIYRKIAVDSPKILLDLPVDEEYERKQKKIYWYVMVLNVIFPILSGIYYAIYENELIINMNVAPLGKTIIVNILVDIVGILQINSGVVLIWSVLSVRSFFKENEAAAVINPSQMMIHAGAFGIYLIGIIVFYGTWVLRTDMDRNQVPKIAKLGESFFLIANFVSQLILVAIFWNLGRKVNFIPDNESEYLNTESALNEQDFDEEAELQMRIWNNFQREDHAAASGIGSTYKLTLLAGTTMRVSEVVGRS